jgi:hypothetical protein
MKVIETKCKGKRKKKENSHKKKEKRESLKGVRVY